MDPSTVFCPNPACHDKGQQGRGNSGIHRQKKQRYRGATCGKTCAATRGTALYRRHHPVEVMVLVVTLLCHGCPTQAIVAAFGLDERTVAAWLHRAGGQAARVHAAVVETGQVDVGQGQVDEICVKVRRGRIWQAMVRAVPSRLWLGGDLSPARRCLGHSDAAAGRRLCLQRGPLDLCGRLRRLWRGRAHGVPGGGAHGTARPSTPGAARDRAAGPRSQEAQRAARGGCHTPRGLRDSGGGRGRHHGQGGRNADQHLRQRAAQRHVPRRVGTPDAARAAPGPRHRAVDQRHVARRYDRHLLLAPRQPPPPCSWGTKVAGAHPGHGRRPDRPRLDHGGTATLPRPPRDGGAPAASDR